MLEEKTVDSVNLLLKEIKDERLKLLISRALENWQSKNNYPGSRCFGIYLNSNLLYASDGMCCMIGSSLINIKFRGHPLTFKEEACVNFRMTMDEVEKIIFIFDAGVNSPTGSLREDSEALLKIRHILKEDKNSVFS